MVNTLNHTTCAFYHRIANKAYDGHRFLKHSDAFPVERLEQAVHQEFGSFPAEEQALTTFGRNHVYRCEMLLSEFGLKLLSSCQRV